MLLSKFYTKIAKKIPAYPITNLWLVVYEVTGPSFIRQFKGHIWWETTATVWDFLTGEFKMYLLFNLCTYTFSFYFKADSKPIRFCLSINADPSAKLSYKLSDQQASSSSVDRLFQIGRNYSFTCEAQGRPVPSAIKWSICDSKACKHFSSVPSKVGIFRIERLEFVNWLVFFPFRSWKVKTTRLLTLDW